MYIVVLFFIALVSLSPFSEKIGKGIIRYKTYISQGIYVLCFLSFLFLLDHSLISESGELALDILWIILWLPVFVKVFSFSLAQKLMPLRKELGILMGVLGMVHSAQYFSKTNSLLPWGAGFWLYDGNITYLAWGFFALVITIVLTLTSNVWSMKKLGGKKWKLLHRSVYFLLLFTLLHVILIEGGEHYILSLFPFFIYIGAKCFEWRKVKIPLNLLAVILISLFFLGVQMLLPVYISPQQEDIKEKSTVISTDILTEQIESVSNVQEVISNCQNLCQSDKTEYCTISRELVFENGNTTYGTCRSFGKYLSDFPRCQGYCKSYGQEKKTSSGCSLKDGRSDPNCKGE